MILGFPRAKQGLCHYDIGGGDPSLIRYSSKTAEQNFMKLSGIVHYMMPYCTSYFQFFVTGRKGLILSDIQVLKKVLITTFEL